jgi:hypothetical protein
MTRRYALIAPPTRFPGPCPECECQGGHLAQCSYSGQAPTAIKDWEDPPRRRPDHGGGSTGNDPKNSLFWAAVGIAGLPIATLAGVAAWLLHGYGVI